MRIAGWCALALCAACGSGGGTSGSSTGGSQGCDPTPWEGNWSLGGTQATTCGAASKTDQLNELIVIKQSKTPGAIDFTASANNCILTFDLDPNCTHAVIEKNQVCTVVDQGKSVTVFWTQSQETLTSPTSITGTTSGATNNGCSFTQQTTLTKM